MRDSSASPLTAGIKALRDIALPLVVIMLAAAGLVVAYYNVPEVATALNRIGAINALKGPIMKRTQGKANPVLIDQLLRKFLA